jgi:hypothetical protein
MDSMDAKIVKRTKKGFTISIEIPYADSVLGSEELIQSQINKAGSLATGEVLMQYDTDGSPIIVDGIKMTSKGLIPKTYQTPYGTVRIERHIYQGPLGGRCHCPLEKEARIIITATPKFAKMVSSKYSDFGAGRVRKDLKDNHGRKVSKSVIQDISDVVGSIASLKNETWEYELPELEKEVETVTVGLDGTAMIMAEDGNRQAMTGTIALYDKDGSRLHTIYNAARPEYGKDIFLAGMEREIQRIKNSCPGAKYVGLADGAKDNWPFLEKHTDKQIIDFYHASGYVGNAGNAVFKDKAEGKKWIEENCHILKNRVGGPDEIHLKIINFSEHKFSNEKDREQVETAVTYFNNNKHRMEYAENIKDNIPIGSGVTEAACKVIVKQRMCNSGMKWGNHGASVVLTLRCLNYSVGRWKQFWNNIDRYGLSLAA